MPTSWYQAIPHILSQVKGLNPKSILDIGIGFGKYGLLFRDLLEIPFERYNKQDWQIKIDGVEVFKDYHNPIYDFTYDNVYFGDILQTIDTLANYDCIILIDVLEHFTKEDGLRLITKLLLHCNKGVIVSTPFYPDHQIEYLGNQYEQHKSIWSIVDFQHFNFNYERIPIEQNGAHLFIFKPNATYKKFPWEVITCNSFIEKKPLAIAYLLPHKNLTGGMKMLLEQMKHLKTRGHKIIAYLKDYNDTQSVLPEWFDLAVDEETLVPLNESFLKYIANCDVIIAGWITQLIELKDSKTPVIYWEQGNEWLFGDISEKININTINKTLEQCYLSNHALLSVSPYVANTIYSRFGRKTPILSNRIDTSFYCPGEKSNTNKILLIGSPYLPFKGFDIAFKALRLVWAAGYTFHVEWVCQTMPNIPDTPFKISMIIQPTQKKLVQCYQSADIHLFTSWYEGFGMPPLEAMACETAVVCTKCGGVDSFVKNEYNALTSEVGDISALAVNIILLLKFPQLRQTLSKNGRKTANELDYSHMILELEAYLYAIVHAKLVH